MESNKILLGDIMEQMKSLPDKSVNCVITSPPYWQLRDYGWSGQWGLESTFEMYLEHMWGMMDEIWRVLTDDGTAWINLGDTYNGSKTGHDDSISTYSKNSRWDENQIKKKSDQKVPDKCLLLIPHRFAIGCIDRGWILRNDVIWGKRNAMPEPVTDRFAKKHEYIFFMVKNKKYFFDMDPIRIKPTTGYNRVSKVNTKTEAKGQMKKLLMETGRDSITNNPSGRNPGTVSDFWDITLRGSSDNHFAAYNENLIKRPILAGCPEFVCKKCGKPRERIIETRSVRPVLKHENMRAGGLTRTTAGGKDLSKYGLAQKEFKGWTDCGCNDGFRPGIVLDPFCGSGTTGVVAIKHGRDFVGIDGKQEYVDLATQKIQLALTGRGQKENRKTKIDKFFSYE